jgi:hypothetical protein
MYYVIRLDGGEQGEGKKGVGGHTGGDGERRRGGGGEILITKGPQRPRIEPQLHPSKGTVLVFT